MNGRTALGQSLLQRCLFFAGVSYCLAAFNAQAQWTTQTLDLKPGWNAVFLHVDATYTNLDGLVGSDPANPILEIWRWNPPGASQFYNSPQNPAGRDSEWTTWLRRSPTSATLRNLVGDSAYLVRVGTNVTGYSWKVKGTPLLPRHSWTVTGINLIGFPTVATTPPSFSTFLAQSPELQTSQTEIYYYPGGELGAGNPLRLYQTLFRSMPVKRGQAYWVRSGNLFNQYFGPFEVGMLSPAGIDFRDNLSTYNFRLKNLTTNSLTVTLRLADSETPPAGQAGFAEVPPLLVRGELNLTNLTYAHTNLTLANARSWTLAPKGKDGADIEVVVGLNRALMTRAAGSRYGGLLRFSDSLGQLQVEVPVAATAGSSAGLWVGGAAVDQVRHYLKSFDRDVNNNLVLNSNGSYVVKSVDTSLGNVSRPFPLRLIVHNPNSGNAVLLQRVYYGLDATTNLVVSTKESALNRNFLSDARRITAPHLPWSETNRPFVFNGNFQTKSNLTATVNLGYNDQAANPFIHTYHPDHDNLDNSFKAVLPQGSESYAVERTITLTVKPPANDFTSLTSARQSMQGDYSEIITVRGLAKAGGLFNTRQFEVRGAFSLNRVSDISTLTIPQ